VVAVLELWREDGGHTVRSADGPLAGRPRGSLQVVLHLRFGSGLGLVGVLAVLPLGVPLAQQVPELVAVLLDLAQPGSLLVGVLPAVAQLARPWPELVADGHAVRTVTPGRRPVRVPLERAALLSLGRAGGAVTRRLAAFVEGWVPEPAP